MTFTITSSMFDMLFFLVMFLFGLDFILSSILVMRDEKRYISRPFLFGLWMLKRIKSIDMSNQNKFASWLFSIKVLTFSWLIGGVFIILDSGIMIMNILLTQKLFSVN